MATGASELVDHLFRHEVGKMIAHLTRRFGPHQLSLAEEAVQDTICVALETWKFYGVPVNPGAWLMRAAVNRAIDLHRRNLRHQGAVERIAADPACGPAPSLGGDEVPEESGLHDDRLALMFSCCHPRLPVQAQLALVLKAICGFESSEIAAAFFSTPQAIEKRIARARNFLRRSKSLFDLDNPAQTRTRLGAVLQAIYLLFNEGYHSLCADAPTRRELCLEAIRLGRLLASDPATQVPETDALLALMYFNLARLSSRVDDEGAFLSLAQQDRSLWDRRLIALGFSYLGSASTGLHVSSFHIEAAIVAKHCQARTFEETDWRGILELYELLATRSISPTVALNRGITVGQFEGPAAGLAALQSLSQQQTLLAEYPFFHAAIGEFRYRNSETAGAVAAFEKALDLARSPAERNFFARKIRHIQQVATEEVHRE